jgi:hypothetical protein
MLTHYVEVRDVFEFDCPDFPALAHDMLSFVIQLALISACILVDHIRTTIA